MTTTKSTSPDVVVVDGSNIATEGRSLPSLAQLNDAVLAFKEEFPGATITVVVDATFGHRISKAEVKDFDDAVAHNEVVAPPAGAIGRGDAFVLSIANKVGARILSNDSFQEFHGDYAWLFDEGRLIGGKPVPFVGWVFVERLPVKGPTSRKSQRASRSPREPKTVRRPASKEASQPMPVPSGPPPGARRSGRGRGADRRVEVAAETVAAEAVAVAESTRESGSSAVSAGAPVNDVLPFLDFVEHHPVGSSVNGVVESYSSHGAYVQVGDLRGYVPLRLMSDPPPRSAREVMRVGDAVTLVVTSFAPSRRSVDLAVPEAVPPGEMQQGAPPEMDALVEAAEALVAAEPIAAKQSPASKAVSAKKTPAKTPSAKKAPGRRTRAVTAPPAEPDTTETSAVKTSPTTKAPATKTAARTPSAVKKAPTKKAPTKKAPTKTTPTKTTPTKTTPTKTTPTKKSPAKQAPARTVAKTALTQAPAKTAATSPSEKAPSKKSPSEETPAKKSPAKKKAPAKKSPAKKAPAAAKAVGGPGEAAER